MTRFYPTIGLEIHIVLNTNTKMFSPSKSIHNDGVNNHINEIDVALPGTMPSVNEAAVIKAITLANVLNMHINTNPITFDRKSYYYWDLPKGYQITQQFNPIGSDGYVELNDDKHTKIYIERIQMEEDTAKQIKTENGNDLLLNYNRSGMPLIEIVSKPVMHSSKEVALYLQALKEIFVFMNISDGKMEEGSMRVDVNVSVSENESVLGTKVEVKNINSISNAAEAVEYEIKRQTELLKNKQKINQETRRFDDTTRTTIFMREKIDAADYKYMTESNIIAIYPPHEFVDNILKTLPITPMEIRKNFRDAGISEKDINLVLSDKKIYDLFIKAYEITKDYKDAERWILNELMGILNKKELTINDLNENDQSMLFAFIRDYKDNKFNSKQAKTLFNDVFAENKNYHNELKKILDNKKSYSDEEIIKLINDVLSKNPDMKNDLVTRRDKVEKSLIGNIMKITHGQVDPLQLKEVLKKIK